jgi:hypothetical protein
MLAARSSSRAESGGSAPPMMMLVRAPIASVSQSFRPRRCGDSARWASRASMYSSRSRGTSLDCATCSRTAATLSATRDCSARVPHAIGDAVEGGDRSWQPIEELTGRRSGDLDLDSEARRRHPSFPIPSARRGPQRGKRRVSSVQDASVSDDRRGPGASPRAWPGLETRAARGAS